MGRQSREKRERKIALEVARAIAAGNSKPSFWKQVTGWPVISGAATFILALGLTASFGELYWLADMSYAVGSVLLVIKFIAWEENRSFSLKKRIILGACVVIFGLAIFKGGLSLNQILIRKKTPVVNLAPLPPPPADYMESRGTSAPYGTIKWNGLKAVEGMPSSDVIADGNLLNHYADKFQLIAVCYHSGATEDFYDISDLSKSGIMDIRPGLISMRIVWNEKFIREMLLNGWRGSGYSLLMIPKGMNANQFDTMRQATKNGAYVIQTAGGPP